jgi:hypothetical protein
MPRKPKGVLTWRADRRVHHGVANVLGRPFWDWFQGYMDAKAREALLELVRLGGLVVHEADLSEEEMKQIFTEALRARDRRLTGLHAPAPITIRVDKASKWKEIAAKYVSGDAIYALATLSVATLYYFASKRGGEEKEQTEAVRTALKIMEKAQEKSDQSAKPEPAKGQTSPVGAAGREPTRPAQPGQAEQGQTTPTTGRPAQPPKPAEQKPGEKA